MALELVGSRRDISRLASRRYVMHYLLEEAFNQLV
jgi:hypothetical protein